MEQSCSGEDKATTGLFCFAKESVRHQYAVLASELAVPHTGAWSVLRTFLHPNLCRKLFSV